MIRINLLPDEMRRGHRAVPRTMGLLLVASVLSFGAIGAAGYLFFNVRARAQSRVEIAREQLDNLAPQARYAESLEQEKAEFQTRSQTIREIASSRILWTRKLDRLNEVITRGDARGRHQAWLNQVDVDSRVDSRNAGVKLRGFTAGPEIESVSNFHEDLARDPIFAQGFVGATAPKSSLEDPEEGLIPPEKVQFSFEMKLPTKDPAQRRR